MKTYLRFLVDFILLLLALLFLPFLEGQQVTLTGNLQGANGLPASNYTLTLTPTQWFFIAGTGVVVNTTAYCGTGADGAVVGITNPLQSTVVTPGFSGTLPASNYYVVYTFYDAAGNQTLPSPESVANLSGTGNLTIPAPVSGVPSNAVGMKVYIGTTSGGETQQGSTTGSATFTQSTPLVSGAALPVTNSTICKIVANDAGWPTGTGYTASLTDTSGNTLPGYPMTWQLLGPNTTINLSNGLPYYHGVVTYPVPILASPLNHAPQSISGPLSLTGYNLVNVGELGVGTGLPAWGIDVEGTGNAGAINAKSGYLVNGSGGTAGQCIGSDGTYFDTIVNCYTGPPPDPFYQIVINGSHDSDKVTQRTYLAVGTGTGLVATDVVGVGSQVGRTVLDVNATGDLTTDPMVVIASAPGVASHLAVWDAAGGIADGGVLPSFTGTSHYQILPGGLILEWGITPTFDTGPTTITFPLTFPHACLMSPQLTDDADVSTTSRIWESGSCTTSTFVARNDGNGAAHWFAIGW